MTGRPLGNLQLPSLRRLAWHLVTLGSLVLATVLAYVVRFEGLNQKTSPASLAALASWCQFSSSF